MSAHVTLLNVSSFTFNIAGGKILMGWQGRGKKGLWRVAEGKRCVNSAATFFSGRHLARFPTDRLSECVIRRNLCESSRGSGGAALQGAS